MTAMDSTTAAMLRILASDIQGMHRALKSGSTLYALIEAGQCSSPDAFSAWVARHGLESSSLFAGTAEAHHAAEGPWLVALSAPCPPAICEELAQLAALPRALLLIGSPLPLLRLTVHLQSWLQAVVQDPQGGRTELLVRHFDACIGMAMVDLWPHAEREAFTGAFEVWCGWDARFALHVRKGRREPEAALRDAPLPVPETLLEKIDALNRAERLAALVVEQDAQPGELDAIAPWMRTAIARQALAQAHALGLEGWQDERIAVALALRIHAEILEQPYMPALIGRSRGHGGLGAVIAAIAPGILEKERATHAAAALQRTADRILAEMTARTREAA